MAQQTPERERTPLAEAVVAYLAAQRYRNAQLEIRRRYLREFMDLWPLLNKASSSDAVARWLRLNVSLVRRWRPPSESLAVEFYRDQSASTVAPRRAAEMPEQQIVRNLLDRGPGVLRRARITGVDELEAEERARVAVAGSGGRMVMDAGRSTIERNAKRTALGWMRVGDGDPCYFCAMLIARGSVYESEATAGRDANSRFIGEGMFKYHDHCGCTVAPIFVRSDFISPDGDRLRKLWNESTAGLTGSDARRAFRAELEGREFTGAREAASTSRNRARGSAQPLGFDTLTREQLENQIGVLEGLPDSPYKRDTLAKYRARLAAL